MDVPGVMRVVLRMVGDANYDNLTTKFYLDYNLLKR